jgi:hypothetical protein
MTVTSVDRTTRLDELFSAGWSPALFTEFWAAPELDRVPGIVTSDVVGIWPAQVVRGRDEYQAALSYLLSLVPDLHLEVPEQAVNGDLTFSRWIMCGTGRQGPFRLNGMDRTRVREGLVCENYIAFDTARFDALVR